MVWPDEAVPFTITTIAISSVPNVGWITLSPCVARSTASGPWHDQLVVPVVEHDQPVAGFTSPIAPALSVDLDAVPPIVPDTATSPMAVPSLIRRYTAREL